MDLNEAFGELVRKYGASVIGEGRLAGLLSDLGALDDPEMRTAAEAFSAVCWLWPSVPCSEK